MATASVHRASREGTLASFSFLLAAPALAVGIAAAVSGEIGAPIVVVAAGALLAAAGLLGLWCAFTTRYEIADFDLILRSGPFRRVIPLEGIEGVMPFRHALPIPARFVDRLAIAFVRDGVPRLAHLTPDDPLRFLDDLVERAPFLERRGDHLVRRPSLHVTA